MNTQGFNNINFVTEKSTDIDMPSQKLILIAEKKRGRKTKKETNLKLTWS